MTEKEKIEFISTKEYWDETIAFCKSTECDLAEHIVRMMGKAINYKR